MKDEFSESQRRQQARVAVNESEGKKIEIRSKESLACKEKHEYEITDLRNTISAAMWNLEAGYWVLEAHNEEEEGWFLTDAAYGPFASQKEAAKAIKAFGAKRWMKNTYVMPGYLDYEVKEAL